MPEKLDRCVNDVKGEKGEDSAWAICTDSLKEEVVNVLAIGGINESHNPLDIPFGREVPETVSIPSSASKIKVGNVNVDNTHSGRDKLNEMSGNVLKQILETQMGECPCKNKSRPKHVSK